MQALKSAVQVISRYCQIKSIDGSVLGRGTANYNIDFSLKRNMSSSGQMYSADYLSEKIKRELGASHVAVEDLSNCGCGMKFDAVIVSPQFEGKPILSRQRLVNQVLTEEMKHIHAFTMRTLTPDQWGNIK